LTDQPPSYPPPPPGGGYPPPGSGGYGYPPPGSGYPPPAPGGYGYPPPGSGYLPPQSVGTNGMAIASLVCSLFGWICVIGPILGLIFGFIALGQIKQTGQGGRGMAIAGVVIGGLIIGLSLVFGILSVLVRPHPHTDTGAPAVVIMVESQAVSPTFAV
jgi:hypothetical protein